MLTSFPTARYAGGLTAQQAGQAPAKQTVSGMSTGLEDLQKPGSDPLLVISSRPHLTYCGMREISLRGKWAVNVSPEMTQARIGWWGSTWKPHVPLSCTNSDFSKWFRRKSDGWYMQVGENISQRPHLLSFSFSTLELANPTYKWAHDWLMKNMKIVYRHDGLNTNTGNPAVFFLADIT